MIFELKRASTSYAEPDAQPHQRAIYDKERECWFIEISDLGDMVEFAKSVRNALIVDHYGLHSEHPRITIYDAYVE